MHTIPKLFGAALLAATLTLAGCAPVSSTWGMGPGLQLGLTPSGTLNLFNSHCSLLATPGAGSPFNRTASGAAVAMTRMQQVSQLQSKFQLASVGAPSREAWKGIAGGGC